MFHKGISTTSYCVLTIDHSCCRLAESMMFSAKLETITLSEATNATSAIAVRTFVVIVPYYN